MCYVLRAKWLVLVKDKPDYLKYDNLVHAQYIFIRSLAFICYYRRHIF